MKTKVATIFKTVEIPKRTIAYVRNVDPYMEDTKLFERPFNEVIGWLAPKQLLQPSAECLSIYHDDPESVPQEQQQISVGFTVPEGTQGEGNIQIMEMSAGKFFVGEFEILASEYGQA